MILFHILAIVLSSGNLGLGGPSKRDNNFGYDGFALTENQYNHYVAEKYVVYQCVSSFL